MIVIIHEAFSLFQPFDLAVFILVLSLCLFYMCVHVCTSFVCMLCIRVCSLLRNVCVYVCVLAFICICMCVIQEIDGCMVINPGHVTKGATGGTYVKIFVDDKIKIGLQILNV